MIRGLIAVWVLLAVAVVAASVSRRSNVPGDMLGATRAFLGSLTPELRAKASFPFNSEERLNWHYIPRERKGVCFKDMVFAQQEAAIRLLHAGLSDKGFKKVAAIRQLEPILKELEQGKGPVRDPDLYFFSVFGEPAEHGTWGWRLEGHHVSLNWTVIKGQSIASTPQFLGSNPGEVREGPLKGTRVLAAEEDLGRALVKSLDSQQRTDGVVSDKAPADILTNNQRVAAIQEDQGIAYAKLTHDQQGVLLTLIREHASTQPADLAKQRLDALRHAGLDKIKFAWMGGLDKGEGHYYRVQGPTFLIEYDNTQNNANHIHCVWREFKGDWGQDLLAAHYQEFPHIAGTHVESAHNH